MARAEERAEARTRPQARRRELALRIGSALVLVPLALGSAYLGAVSFEELRAAGRVEELADGAVRRADALFAWRPLPWCPEIF